MGGWDESHVISYVEDMCLRCKACGKLGFVMDEDAAGIYMGGQTPTEAWQMVAKHLPKAYADQSET